MSLTAFLRPVREIKKLILSRDKFNTLSLATKTVNTLNNSKLQAEGLNHKQTDIPKDVQILDV